MRVRFASENIKGLGETELLFSVGQSLNAYCYKAGILFPIVRSLIGCFEDK